MIKKHISQLLVFNNILLFNILAILLCSFDSFHVNLFVLYYFVFKIGLDEKQNKSRTLFLNKWNRGLGGLVVYSSDSHGDGTGLILAAGFGYTLVTTDLYGGKSC